MEAPDGRGHYTTADAPPFHAVERLQRTAMNRVFAVVYTCAILALLYRHAQTLLLHLHSTTLVSFFITLSFLLSDLVLAFMWAASQAFRMYPIRRKQFPQNLKMNLKEQDFPGLDVFICTADPHKEPPMSVVNTALSLMAYDYPMEKISVYVSDDGGSALTLFAFMEAAKFASYWLPFCRENNVTDRSPDVYFGSAHSCSPEAENIEEIYENMKVRVENVVNRGEVSEIYITNDQERQAFNKWTTGFTPQHHPTVIQVLLDRSKDKDITGHFLPNLVYVSREKSKTSPHHFKAGALNVLMGFRYGSLVEDFYTGYRLQCDGWRSIFCNPERAAFLGNVPINLVDVLNQCMRWAVGVLEMGSSKYSPLTFGTRSIGLLMGLGYSHYAYWPLLSISVTVYSFLPQLALLNGVSVFPESSEPWFLLYLFLFFGAYGQDAFEYFLEGATFRKWWNAQRMWMMRKLSSFSLGTAEYFLKSIGLSSYGFNVTNKVVDSEQSKRYWQGVFEFGVPSPLFAPPTMAAIINLFSFIWGTVLVFNGSDAEGLYLQVLLAGCIVVNCFPIYEAIALRSDKGKMPTKITIIATFLAGALYAATSIILKR